MLFLHGILGYFVLLFRFAESKCDEDLPKWIAVYFWCLSLKEKDKKKLPSPPYSSTHTGYSPWIMCGRDAGLNRATFLFFLPLTSPL